MSNREFTEAEEILKEKLEDYLQAQGINTSKPFRCLNPEHPDKNPSMSYDRRRNKAHCFSCGADYSIIDLIGMDYSLTDFKDIMQKGAELYNLGMYSAPREQRTNKGKPQEKAPDPEADYTEFYKQAAADLSKAADYLKYRNISPATAERFSLGYVENWKHPKAPTAPASPRLIIPINKGAYLARDTRPELTEAQEKYKKSKVGAQDIFNKEVLRTAAEPIFITEGELDAISIYEAGGQALAMGSLTYKPLLYSALEELPTKQPLILTLDNEAEPEKAERVKKKSAEIAEKLKSMGFNVYELCVQLPYKDANEALIKDKQRLIDRVKEAKALAEETKAAEEEERKKAEIESGQGLYPVEDYKELFIKHRTADTQRISTGYHSLDLALNGGFNNELYILSAETSIGKSAITACLAQNIAASGIDVLYYALEMSRDEFIARGASMISKECGNPIPYGEIINYKWDEKLQEFTKLDFATYEPYLNEYIKRYGQHLYFIEGGFNGKTAKEIADTAEQFKKDHNINQLVIVIDYLQRLKADPEDRAQRDAMSITSAAVQILGNLASQNRNTVIAISSISNSQQGQEVTTAAGKYSGDISYTGGILLGWNWKGYTDTTKKETKEETAERAKDLGYREMYLGLLKNRSGERDSKLTLHYYPAYNYFSTPEIKKGRKY